MAHVFAPILIELIWNTRSHSDYKGRDGSNYLMSDSYIKSEGDQNRYQQLKINLEIPCFPVLI